VTSKNEVDKDLKMLNLEYWRVHSGVHSVRAPGL